MMWFQVLLYLWIVTSWLCIDKIPEIAKTEVSKPKRYSWSNLRFYHTPLKRLSQTHPHMSTSRCGNICIRHGFSNRNSVEAAVTERSCEQQRILWTTVSAWTDGKTKDITFTFISLHSFWKLAIMERSVKFSTSLVVFGQSQCSVSVGQSEQTVLVGRRDFVENEAFERGGE